MLTENKIKSLKSKEKKYELLDGNGLYVRVYPSGKKVYLLRVMYKRYMYNEVLGECNRLTLLDARLKACHFLSDIEDETENKVRTFKSVYEEWAEEKKQKIKHWYVVENLVSHVLPKIGKLGIETIDDSTLKSALRELEDQGKINTIHRVIFKVNEIMRFAYSMGYIERIKTQYAIQRFPKLPAIVHRAWIDPDKLNIVLDSFKHASDYYTNFFMFSIYSMLRPGENAILQWDWIDWKNNILTIPGQSMKMKRDHQVPLSSQMLQILRKMRELNISDTYVFATIRKGGASDHITKAAFQNFLKKVKLLSLCSPHGFRATARTWMARVHIQEQVAEACLAHVSGNQVVVAYNHETFLEERRKVMQQWADFVDSKR